MISETIERLLKGEFLCEVTAPKCVRDLREEDSRKTIDDTLSNINRYVVDINDTVFYAAIKNITDTDRRRIESEINTIRTDLRPIIECLLTIMHCTMRDNPISVNEQLSKARITNELEMNDNIRKMAVEVVTIIKGIRDDKTSATYLADTIFSYLVKQNILLANPQNDGIYTTTGKLQYIYRVMDFIDQHENITNEVRQNDDISDGLQGDLFDGF